MIDMSSFDSASAVLAGGAWIRLQGPRSVQVVRWHGGGQAPALVGTDADGQTVVIPLASLVAVQVVEINEYVPPHAHIDTTPVGYERSTLGAAGTIARGPAVHPANVSNR